MTTAATAPKCAVRASTPNDAPSANAAGKSGAATRTPLRTLLSEGAGLFAVAANCHVAPLTRAVARVVDERPAARVGLARLQALPRAVGHRLADGGEQEPEPARGTLLPRDEADRAVGEAHVEPGAPGHG